MSKNIFTLTDRFISIFSPVVAVRRARARIVLKGLRDYEGAKKAKRRSNWTNAKSTTQNQESLKGAVELRNRARDLIRNNGWSKSAWMGFGTDLVGSGIKPKFRKDGQITTEYDASWKAWAESTLCDASNRKNFYAIERLAALTYNQSGECFIRKISATHEARNPDTKVPQFKLQIFEPDYLDITFEDKARRIIQGIEYDISGKPLKYHFFKSNPNDGGGTPARVAINADEVIHLYDERRPGQSRGITEFDAGIETIKSVDDYEDAGLQGRKIQALLSTFITGIEPDDNGDPSYEIPDTLEPGGVVTLPAQADIKTVTPPMMSEHKEYTRSLLHKYSAGMNRSYESVSHDLSDTNYSSIRAGRVDQDKFISSSRDLIFIPNVCETVANWFLDDLIINAPKDITTSWIRPPITMIDPEKEISALKYTVRNGFESLPDIQTKLGGDPDEVANEIQASNQVLDEKSIILDTDPRNTDQAGKARMNTEVTEEE